MEFIVVLEQDQDGSIMAEVPTLPGCQTSGRTRDEALRNIREAIELYLEVQGPPLARFMGIERVTVPG